jgi:hypothetical protein
MMTSGGSFEVGPTRKHVEARLGGRRRIAGREPVIEDQGRVAAGPEQMLLGRNLAQVLVARRPDEGEMTMAFDCADVLFCGVNRASRPSSPTIFPGLKHHNGKWCRKRDSNSRPHHYE